MLTDNQSDIMNEHTEDHVITILDQDAPLSNQFSVLINNNDDISITKISENSKKLGQSHSNDNIPKQLITTLNVPSKKHMVTDWKRKYNISSNNKNSKTKNLSVIIRDSIIKEIKSWKLLNESKIFAVKFFGGDITKDIESYIQPTIERAPCNAILHCGTNDSKASTDHEQIAENSINLPKSMKTDKNIVIVSELTPRNGQLNKKAKEVNEFLTQECNKRKIGIIKHDNRNARRHCNMSGLHLNWKGRSMLIKRSLVQID